MKKGAILLTGIVLSIQLSVFANTKKTVTVIFVDKSLSFNALTETRDKYEQFLKAYLPSNTGGVGSVNIISYLYRTTGSATNQQKIVFEAPQLNTSNVYGKRKEQLEAQHNQKLSLYKRLHLKKTLNKIFELEASSQATDILASVQILAQIRTQYPSDQFELHCIYLSDMIHSVGNVNFRYGKGFIDTISMSEARARKDKSSLISKYGFDNGFLKGITITVIFPASKGLDEKKEYELLPYYYTRLFQGLECSAISFQ